MRRSVLNLIFRENFDIIVTESKERIGMATGGIMKLFEKVKELFMLIKYRRSLKQYQLTPKGKRILNFAIAELNGEHYQLEEAEEMIAAAMERFNLTRKETLIWIIQYFSDLENAHK